MKNIFYFILRLLGITGKKKYPRLKLEDVRRGDNVYIEWEQIKGKIGFLTCLNNDPKTKKIYLQAHWGNFEKYGFPEFQNLILDYKDYRLMNFNLLNGHLRTKKPTAVTEVLGTERDKAVDAEQYEIAGELQKAIDKIKTYQHGEKRT